MRLHLDKNDKSFLKKGLKVYLSINAVIAVVGLGALIYGANTFYSSWKENDANFKKNMLASVSEKDEFNKMFKKHQQDVSDIMNKESKALRERRDEHMKISEQNHSSQHN